jgi:hypothetical protein
MYRDSRLSGRLVAFLQKRLSQTDFNDVPDPRGRQGKRWSLAVLLKSMIVGMSSGQKSLADLENVTSSLTSFSRRVFGIQKRIPDTTLRDLLVRLNPKGLRQLIYAQIKQAVRRKSLAPDAFPCGIVAIDGKWVATKMADSKLTQTHRESGGGSHELLRTITSCLVSSKAKVCIDARPLSPNTNEVAGFKQTVRDLLKAYGRSLFEVITYDAGGYSESNGSFINDLGLGYVFGLKDHRKYMFRSAVYNLERLPAQEALAQSRDYVAGKVVIRQLWMTSKMRGDWNWPHLKHVLRVRSQVIDPKTGFLKSVEDRYFITNIHEGRFSKAQWLELIRRHWQVENNCHNIWDRIYREDDRVWIREPRGMLAVQLLRRFAFNLMALFRSVTQRSAEKRETPWKTLMRELYKALLVLSENSVRWGRNEHCTDVSVDSC